MRSAVRVWRAVVVCAAIVVVAGCGGAAARKQGFLERGDEYFAKQNFEKARVEYRNAAQIDPTDAQAHFSLARTAEKMGNVKDAAGQYQATIDLNPKHAGARAALARLFLLGGLLDRAQQLVDDGLHETPDEPQLLTARAGIHAAKRELDAALADARAAFAKNPNDEYTIALLASLHKQRGEVSEARNVVGAGLKTLPRNVDLHVVMADLALSQGDRDESERQLKEVISLEPKTLAHRYRLARFYMADKKLDAAEAVLRDAVKADEGPEAKSALIEFLSAQRGATVAEKQLQEFSAAAPKDDGVKLQLGGFYERQQNWSAAEKEYRDVIATAGLKPNGLAARNRLAAMSLKRSDIENGQELAQQLITDVLKENPRDNDALIMRGNLALMSGDTASAITDMRSVLRDQPYSAPVLRALARAHVQNSELPLAEEALRNAVQANPTDIGSRLDLARVLAQGGKIDQSRPILEQLVKDAPNDVDALETLVRVQMMQKDFSAARQAASSITTLRPDSASGEYLLGAIDETEGKFDSAIKHYDVSTKISPTTEVMAAYVRVELARKRPDAALTYLDSNIATYPKLSAAHLLRGEILASQGKASDAAKSYEAAMSAQPKWWAPYRGLAVLQAMNKDYDGAAAWLRRGLSATDESGPLYGELSALYERAGKPSDAAATYEAWLKRHPHTLAAANNLAMLLVTHNSDAKSLQRAKELVVQLQSSNEPTVLDTRGWVDYKNGNFLQAIELLQRAIADSRAKAPPSFKYHLGMAQLASGDTRSARKNLEAAISEGKAFVGIDEAQATLKKLQQNGV